LYNADDRAKWILANDPGVREGLIQLFGKDTFQNNQLNRQYISQQIFNDKAKLEKLNALVHPQVGSDFEKWLEGKQNYPYILKEAALLFEAGSYKGLDKIITVYAPLELRIQRILERDPHRDEEGIRKIMKEQMAEEEKMERADYIIYNDEKKMLIPQVLKLHKLFQN
jgi:dephospho-CoA kinase